MHWRRFVVMLVEGRQGDNLANRSPVWHCDALLEHNLMTKDIVISIVFPSALYFRLT
jgi:hypothetical protein